jgi:predicted membrane metal-binding protein
MNFTNFLKTHLLKIIGIPVGMLGGYLYYFYIGCSSGTCPITSNPYISVIYGGLMGYLIFDLFKKKESKTNEQN